MKALTLFTPLPICLATVLPLSAPATMPTSAQPSVRTASTDVKAVTVTVHAFYAAERSGNGTRWRALTTPDFYMFHEGEHTPPDDFTQWIDHEGELLRNNPGAWWKINIGDLKVDVGGTAAIATLTLHNVMDAPHARALKQHPVYDETFLESLWLKKAPDGRWKIAFWHSTKVPKPTPPASADKT